MSQPNQHLNTYNILIFNKNMATVAQIPALHHIPLAVIEGQRAIYQRNSYENVFILAIRSDRMRFEEHNRANPRQK